MCDSVADESPDEGHELMRVFVKVHEMADGSFDLLTDRGHIVGGRLLSVPPKKKESMPVVPEKIEGKIGRFTDRNAAYASCMQWSLYLKHAWEHRVKSKDRGRE